MGVTEGSRNSVMFLGGGDNKEKKNKTNNFLLLPMYNTI